jgi:hypothetical protein
VKTTAKHFAIFKRTCEEYRRKLGLFDWEFRYVHKTHPDGDALAYCVPNVAARIANVYLCVEWGDLDVPTTQSVKLMARHETLHVLMADLMDLASRQHGSNPDTRGQAEHAVIRRLERII